MKKNIFPEFLSFQHQGYETQTDTPKMVSKQINLGKFTFKLKDFANWIEPGGYNSEYQSEIKESFLAGELEYGTIKELPQEIANRSGIDSFLIYLIENKFGEVYCHECKKTYETGRLRITIEGIYRIDKKAFCFQNHLLFQGASMHVSFKDGKEVSVNKTTRLGSGAGNHYVIGD